jgi:hypothetical protein
MPSIEEIEDRRSDEKIAEEYLNISRKFVSQLHSKELYTENPSWQNTRGPRLRGDDVEMRIIVSPVVESYMQLLEECFRRRLAEPIYSECLTMTENILNGLSNLPGCDNATSLATIHDSQKDGDSRDYFRSPSITQVFAYNMLYISWLWFHHQDKLDSIRPIAIISHSGMAGRSDIYARTLTFECGDFTFLSGMKEWSSIDKKWLKDSRISKSYTEFRELYEMGIKLS